jgi:23S rRNA (adenine2503-C2)-methyltransferase
MPINKIYGLKELHQTISAFCKKTGKQILIAYVLIKGENDSLKHADQLAEFLTGLDVKINVIPYNPQSRDRFQCPDQSTLDEFTNYLRHKGYYTLLRQTKGQKIMAACGQLGNLALKRKKSLLSITQVN